jgi:predicted NUDIX family NTP pyrophosphohydrolase
METNSVKISAGLLIIQDDKILLEHPTGAVWYGTYGIPKGEIEEGENLFGAALREFEEELGIHLDPDKLKATGPEMISYIRDDVEFKRMYYFVCHYEDRIVIDPNKLQRSEVDWAGFLSKTEAKTRIFWRQYDILKHIR